MRRFLIGLLALDRRLTVLAVGVAVFAFMRLAGPRTADCPASRILLTADWRESSAEATARPDLSRFRLRPRPYRDRHRAGAGRAPRPTRAWPGSASSWRTPANGLGATQELREAVHAVPCRPASTPSPMPRRSVSSAPATRATTWPRLSTRSSCSRSGWSGLTGLGAQVPLARTSWPASASISRCCAGRSTRQRWRR